MTTKTTRKSIKSVPVADDLPLPAQRSVKVLNLQIRLDQRLLDRIQRQADAKGLPASAMARMLIMERLNELEG